MQCRLKNFHELLVIETFEYCMPKWLIERMRRPDMTCAPPKRYKSPSMTTTQAPVSTIITEKSETSISNTPTLPSNRTVTSMSNASTSQTKQTETFMSRSPVDSTETFTTDAPTGLKNTTESHISSTQRSLTEKIERLTPSFAPGPKKTAEIPMLIAMIRPQTVPLTPASGTITINRINNFFVNTAQIITQLDNKI